MRYIDPAPLAVVVVVFLAGALVVLVAVETVFVVVVVLMPCNTACYYQLVDQREALLHFLAQQAKSHTMTSCYGNQGLGAMGIHEWHSHCNSNSKPFLLFVFLSLCLFF